METRRGLQGGLMERPGQSQRCEKRKGFSGKKRFCSTVKMSYLVNQPLVFHPRPVILALQVQSIGHGGMNAGIQSFELNDWMPAYHFGHDRRRMIDIRVWG